MSRFRFPACAALAAAAWLHGCASYAPKPLDPARELAELAARAPGTLRIEYARAGAPADRAPLVFDARDGLDEAELAALALCANPELRARRAAVGEAQALLVSAGKLPNPELGSFARAGVGGSSGTALGLEALFGLLRPDERPARRALAEAELELARAGIARAELELVARVRRARIGVLAAGAERRLADEELGVRAAAVELVRRQRELGEATALALALVELDRAQFERAVREARAGEERARRELNELLGIPPGSALELEGSGRGLVFTLAADTPDAELEARLLGGAPELRARAAEYRRAEAELRLAVALQRPGLRLGPSYERDVEGSAALGLSASIELPLFDRNQGGIAAKWAQRERARGEYAAELHALRARACAARAEVRRARAEVETQRRELLPLVERTEALFESALRARELTASEWLAARGRALEARRAELEALHEYAGAVVDLETALGSPLVAVVRGDEGEELQRNRP